MFFLSRRPEAPTHEVVIELGPRRGWQLLDFRELWRYRELLWMLGLRDLKVRYKQAVIGAAWAILQPVTTMLVFALFFHLLGRVPSSDAAPYFITLFCALLPWQFFATSFSQGATSLIESQGIIKKVYFPRAIIPSVPLVSALVDFGLSFVVLLVMMIVSGVQPGWGLLALPLFMLLALVAALAASLWFSALAAIYRDLVYVVPFVVQVGFFISPVIFETRRLIPDAWLPLFAVNPMVCVLEGFRWALLAAPAPPPAIVVPGVLSSAVLLITGMFYFRRMERTFVDRL